MFNLPKIIIKLSMVMPLGFNKVNIAVITLQIIIIIIPYIINFDKIMEFATKIIIDIDFNISLIKIMIIDPLLKRIKFIDFVASLVIKYINIIISWLKE